MIGATFTFVLAIGDFVTPQMVGGISGITFGRDRLQPVRPRLQLAVRRGAVGDPAAVVVLAVALLASRARPAARARCDDLALVRSRSALRVIAALALVILYGPLLLTVFFSFFTSDATACSGTASAFDWYVALLAERRHHRGAGQHPARRRRHRRPVAVLLGTLLAF